MTPEIIEQYYLWDEVAKKEVERYPWLLLPLIQEVFHKVYPENADIAVQIENRDIYHMECQMNKDKGMVLRMLEYDIHIGLVHGTGTVGKAASMESRHELVIPRSVILYLNDTDCMPVEETCLIRFADGTTHEYRVPVMNVQSYTTEMIENLTEFIRECIMIIDREKENGTLTDIAGKEMIEFLSLTCGY